MFVAKWPNGSVTILSANSEFELFDKLDFLGNPDKAKLLRLKDEEDFLLDFEIDVKKNRIDVNDGWQYDDQKGLKRVKNLEKAIDLANNCGIVIER